MSADKAINRLLGGATPRPPEPKALALAQAIRQWQAEDGTDDEEELNRRDRERADLQANLNDARHRAGMRPLFPERRTGSKSDSASSYLEDNILPVAILCI